MERKEKLRKKILKKRNRLKPEDLSSKSDKIINALFRDGDFVKAKNILYYMSIRSEVKTRSLVSAGFSEKGVYLPKVNLEKKILEIYKVESFGDIKEGCFDIPEPITLSKAGINEIDLVIVPGIVFDKKGYRLGYGGGYYDKLLKSFIKPKIGLAYDVQVVRRVPKESHDIAVDKIITEKHLIICK